ncbi:MAG TPA: hypothetical protein VFZ18_12605 [Longimicrobiaceae bacterium]
MSSADASPGFGILTWLGLYLREERRRGLLPFRYRSERGVDGR